MIIIWKKYNKYFSITNISLNFLQRAEELVERDRLEKIRREKEEEERKIRVERGLEIDEIPPEPGLECNTQFLL